MVEPKAITINYFQLCSWNTPKCYTRLGIGGIFLILLCCSYSPTCDGARILAVYSFPGTSHYQMHSTIIRELIRNGHEVTMVTGRSLQKFNLGQNYTEILIEPVYDFWKDVTQFFKADNVYALSELSLFDCIQLIEIIGHYTTDHALKQPKVKALINHPNPRGQFDLLLCEQFYQEPFLALSYIYDIPVITSGTLGFENHMSQMMGYIAPWSFVPHGFTSYSDRMSFLERLMNAYYSLGEDLLREYRYFPKMDQMVTQYFGHLNVTIPPITQMEKNISLMLLNSHIPLSSPMPLPSNMIFVGGVHIYPPKKLPEDIQKFMDGADNGVIFFSLGSNVLSKDMPTEKLLAFLDVFRSMKQRVVWKFENESIPRLPSNVLIKAWLPQNDILAHPNVKVFITHGGLFGTQEAVYHGIPTLGIPFYCDQTLNLKKAERNGYTIILPFAEITRNTLRKSLEKLIYDPSYKENIKRFSAVFRDRPMDSKEEAMYWIDYVIRYKGAPQLRSAAHELTWYQLYLLDVIGFVIGGIMAAVALLVYLIRLPFKSKKNKNEKIKMK